MFDFYHSQTQSGLSAATSTSAGLSLPKTKSTGLDCGQTQAATGELLEQTGLRLDGQQQVGGLHLYTA